MLNPVPSYPLPNIRTAERIHRLNASPIREILSVIDRPGMVSFAGGLPDPATFATPDLSGMPAGWLQYGPSEGEPALRDKIADQLATLGLDCSADQVIILSGSQQGIDLVAKLLVHERTPVALETPTYLAALQVFHLFGAHMMSLSDEDPAGSLARMSSRPAFCYLIPNFQNPTGRCLGSAMRDALAQVLDDRQIILFEDDPYRDLVYGECDRSPIAARLRRAPWIYQGSFSKSFAPGLRLGFMAASAELMPWLIRLKQAADLHSCRISQYLALEFLNAPDRATRLAQLAAHYAGRRDDFQRQLGESFKDLATWSTPEGGLFFWLRLTQAVDTSALLARAIGQQVAFMPGEPFFANVQDRYPSIRLNFSHASPAQMTAGLSTLAALLREG